MRLLKCEQKVFCDRVASLSHCKKSETDTLKMPSWEKPAWEPRCRIYDTVMSLYAMISVAIYAGTNCIKIGLPGKLILGDYFQENMTSQRPFLLLRISFPGRLFFIQWPPAIVATKMIAYENFFYHLNEDALHICYITVAIAFIVYVLVFTYFQKKSVQKSGRWESKRMVVEHHKVCHFICGYN